MPIAAARLRHLALALVATVALCLSLLASTADTAQAAPAGCRESYIPQITPGLITHSSGAYVHLLRLPSRAPNVRVWINGQYAGDHPAPFSIGNNTLRVANANKLRLVNGQYRYEITQVVYLCDARWVARYR